MNLPHGVSRAIALQYLKHFTHVFTHARPLDIVTRTVFEYRYPWANLKLAFTVLVFVVAVVQRCASVLQMLFLATVT